MTDSTAEVPLDGTEPTIYVGVGPTRKDGSPVLGNFGKGMGQFVIIDMATWKKLCADHPTLQTARFRVGQV